MTDEECKYISDTMARAHLALFNARGEICSEADNALSDALEFTLRVVAAMAAMMKERP